MTQIIIPIPKTQAIDLRTGQFTREWFRVIELLIQASGGTTNTTIDISSFTPPEPARVGGDLGPEIPGELAGEVAALQASSTSESHTPFAMAPIELGQLQAEVAALETAVEALQTDVSTLQTEVADLQAAENLIYRIVDAGEAVMVGGTVTVASAQADSANQFSLTTKLVGGTQGMLSVGTVIANTSFVINSSDPADTSTVSWVIFKAI